MHEGRVLVSDTPEAIREGAGAATLNDAFIHHLERAQGESGKPEATNQVNLGAEVSSAPQRRRRGRFSLARLMSFSWRESLELRRDPIRLTLASVGSVILMIVL